MGTFTVGLAGQAASAGEAEGNGSRREACIQADKTLRTFLFVINLSFLS